MKKDNNNPDWSKVSSVEELKKLVQEFIDDPTNEINRFKDLPNYIKNKIWRTGLNSSYFKFKELPFQHWEGMDKLKIQELINKEKYEKFSDLPGGLINHIRSLGLISRDFIFPKSLKDWSSYNTKLEFQQYITTTGILRYQDIPNSLKSRLKRFGFHAEDFTFSGEKKPRRNWSKYTEFSDFKKFLIENNIQSRKEFMDNYEGLYTKSRKLGYLNKLEFPKDKSHQAWDLFKTKSDIEEYLINNNIKLFKDLPRECMSKIYSMGYKVTDFPQLDSYLEEKGNWKEYESLDKIKEFIIQNNIQTSTEFHKNYKGLSEKLRKLGHSTSEIKFPKRKISVAEINIEKFLKENNINFETQKAFSNLGKMKFDFWIPEFNLILEPGGDQHFISVNYFGGEEKFNGTQKRDLKKYEYCKSNGITIIYFFNLYNKEAQQKLFSNGYIPGSEWYTDFEKFKERILELTNKGKA